MLPEYSACSAENDAIRLAFVKCFTSKDGREVLAFLRRMTLERYLPPASSAEELRHLEGQRHLVKYIEMLSSPYRYTHTERKNDE